MVVSLSFRGSVVQIGDHLFWVINYHSVAFHIDEYLKLSMPPSKRRALASRSNRKRKFFGVRKQDILVQVMTRTVGQVTVTRVGQQLELLLSLT